MPRVQILGYKCSRCGHEWPPRNKDQKPHVCPACKSPYWDEPRQDGKKRSSKKQRT